jgi:hypothetical protein
VIAASHNRAVGQSDVLRMRFSWSIYCRQDFVLALFNVRRPIRFVQDTYFQLDGAKFVKTSSVYAKTILVK